MNLILTGGHNDNGIFKRLLACMMVWDSHGHKDILYLYIVTCRRLHRSNVHVTVKQRNEDGDSTEFRVGQNSFCRRKQVLVECLCHHKKKNNSNGLAIFLTYSWPWGEAAFLFPIWILPVTLSARIGGRGPLSVDGGKYKPGFFGFIFSIVVVQHCFICRTSDFTVSEAAGTWLGPNPGFDSQTL